MSICAAPISRKSSHKSFRKSGNRKEYFANPRNFHDKIFYCSYILYSASQVDVDLSMKAGRCVACATLRFASREKRGMFSAGSPFWICVVIAMSSWKILVYFESYRLRPTCWADPVRDNEPSCTPLPSHLARDVGGVQLMTSGNLREPSTVATLNTCVHFKINTRSAAGGDRGTIWEDRIRSSISIVMRRKGGH
jgi:hypothetical protein